jgi:hypothetical protein
LQDCVGFTHVAFTPQGQYPLKSCSLLDVWVKLVEKKLENS